jgi:DNA replication protein DnaC
MGACGRGRRAGSDRVTGPATLLREAREGRQLARPRAQLARPGLLILDGLGDVPAGRPGAGPLSGVIGTAGERASAVVTTSPPLDRWPEAVGSGRPTGAAPDRLTHRSHILESGGAGYRTG